MNDGGNKNTAASKKHTTNICRVEVRFLLLSVRMCHRPSKKIVRFVITFRHWSVANGYLNFVSCRVVLKRGKLHAIVVCCVYMSGCICRHNSKKQQLMIFQRHLLVLGDDGVIWRLWLGEFVYLRLSLCVFFVRVLDSQHRSGPWTVVHAVFSIFC